MVSGAGIYVAKFGELMEMMNRKQNIRENDEVKGNDEDIGENFDEENFDGQDMESMLLKQPTPKAIVDEGNFLNFEQIRYKGRKLNNLYKAYFLSNKVMLIKDSSIQRSDLLIGDISGKHLFRLNWKKSKIPYNLNAQKYKYTEVFICPKKQLLFITGVVTLNDSKILIKDIKPKEKKEKAKKGKKRRKDSQAKRRPLASFMIAKNDKLKTFNRAIIEVLYIPSILAAFEASIHSN